MDITGVRSNPIEASTRALGDLLKNITSETMNLDKKMTGFAVAEQVSNSGKNLDIQA